MASTKGAGDSGIGRQNADPRPGGSTLGAAPRDGQVTTRQRIEGGDEDDLSAASEMEMVREAARSTPPMGDVRSDGDAGAGPANGEPL